MSRRTRITLGALMVIAPILLAFDLPVRTLLEGRITNRATGEPVDSATVELAVAGASTLSDEAGYFSFGDEELTADDTLVIRHPGYAETRITIGASEREVWRLEIGLLRGALRPSAPEEEVR